MKYKKSLIYITIISLILTLTGCLNKSDNDTYEINDIYKNNHLNFVISVDPQNCGFIEGIVKDPDGNFVEEAFVYAKYGNDYVDSSTVTDSNGYFCIETPEGVDYSIHITKNEMTDEQNLEYEFFSKVLTNITVTLNNTTDLGNITLEESEDQKFASITGNIYCDTQETIPVSEAIVIAYNIIGEDDEMSDLYVGITDDNGFFKMNFVSSGSYRLYILKGINVNSDEITFSITENEADSRIIKELGDFVLLNNSPVLDSYFETIEVTLPISEEDPLLLSVNASDEDSDILQYRWTATGGFMDISDDNRNLWITDTAGTYEVKVFVTDNKSDELIYKTWLITVLSSGNPAPEILVTTVPANNGWNGRLYHGTISSNDKIYILNGEYNNILQDEIFSFSPATNTWTDEMITTPETYNYSRILQFDSGAIILGADTTNDMIDFWITSDFSTWTNLNLPKNDDSISARCGFEAIVTSGDHIQIFGGISCDETLFYNDLFEYLGGACWDTIAYNTNPIYFPERAYSSFIEFNDKIWTAGGYNTSGYLSDVWFYSEYTEEWNLATNDAFNNSGGRKLHCITGVNGYLVITGGLTENGATDEIWYSSDGINWNLSDTHLPNPVYGHSAIQYNNKIYITGGNTGSALNSDTYILELNQGE